MLFYDEVASRCDFGVNLASCWHQKTIKIAPWRRLGASWVRLGAFWTRLWASWGGSWAVLGHLGRVLEASWASWGRLGGVLGCLGGCGAQRRDAARARRGRRRDPRLPGWPISKDNLTKRPACRRSDTPWASGPANSLYFSLELWFSRP